MMTIMIRDPTIPHPPRDGASLKEMLDGLHDNPTIQEYDLDDAGDYESLNQKWGEELLIALCHLEEGESLTFTCLKRVDP